jgi:uncharacterized protein (TIGR02246 family)
MMARPVVSVLALCFAAACAPAAKPVDTAADEQALRDLVTAWNGYIASQNDSAVAAIYATDAVLMAPNAPAITGRDAIRQFWAGFWSAKPQLTITPRWVSVSGDLAVESGVFSLSMIPGPDGVSHDNGKYLVAWKRTAEGWKVTHDIYNSDNPPPPPPPAK